MKLGIMGCVMTACAMACVPARAADAGSGSEGTSYADATVACDLSSLGVGLMGAPLRSAVPSYLGVGGYLLCAPIVHIAHRGGDRAAGSVGLRIGLPAAGALIDVLFFMLPVSMVGLFCLLDLARAEESGGWAASYRQAEEQKWGLRPGESVVRLHRVGEAPPAPWSPRGRILHIVTTSRNRLVIAREADDFASLGGVSPKMQPILAFSPEEQRPSLLVAEQALFASPQVGRAVHAALPNAEGEIQPLLPALLLIPNGQRFPFFCEPAGLAELEAWCQGA